jgi:hypothetical protein
LGTNFSGYDPTVAALLVAPLADGRLAAHELVIRAGSRNRWLTPGDDNFGFAAWVRDNAHELAQLGEGNHYGEWFGKGIQRGYGLDEKRFALFNTGRWYDPKAPGYQPFSAPAAASPCPPCTTVVPILKIHDGKLLTYAISEAVHQLRTHGSWMVPGYDRPEGVVAYHTAASQLFKVLLENDDVPKSLATMSYSELVAAGIVHAADGLARSAIAAVDSCAA